MNKKASIYNLFAVGIKVLSGPLVYFLMATKFDSFILVAYFFILAINNLRTIFEGGVTNIIKRKYITYEKKELENLSTFSYYWFFMIAFILFIVSIILGGLYAEYVLNNFNSIIMPLALASFASSLRVRMLYMDAYVDGFVSSSDYRRSIFLSSIMSTIALIIAIEYDFKLYSIFISQIVQVIVIYFSLRKDMNNFRISDKQSFKIFKKEYQKSMKLIKSTVKTWSVGYLFWNSTILIVPVFFEKEISSKILFTYSLFKSIYDLAASVFMANIPLITNKIKTKRDDLLATLVKISIISSFLYLFGSIFLIIVIYLNIIEALNSKFLGFYDSIYIVILFFIILLKTIIHNFVRCFEVEPFFYFILYNAIVMLISPIIIYYFNFNFFLPHSLFLLPMIYYSILELKYRLKRVN
jgi:hypothetical protein